MPQLQTYLTGKDNTGPAFSSAERRARQYIADQQKMSRGQRRLARETRRILREDEREADRRHAKALRQQRQAAEAAKRFRAQLKSAAVAGAAFAAGNAAAARGGLGFIRQIETATIQFQTFFKTAQEAERHIRSLADFAARTPFQLPGLLDASRQLKVFGADTAYGGDTLRVLGDAAANVTQPLESVAFWFGRMHTMLSGGNAAIGEMNTRFQEMGLLSGEGRRKIEDLAKGGADLAGVMRVMREEFDRHSGGMDKLSRTMGGIESTWRDAYDQMAGAITEMLGVDEAWKRFLGWTTERMNEITEWARGDPAEQLHDVSTQIADIESQMAALENRSSARDRGKLKQLQRRLEELLGVQRQLADSLPFVGPRIRDDIDEATEAVDRYADEQERVLRVATDMRRIMPLLRADLHAAWSAFSPPTWSLPSTPFAGMLTEGPSIAGSNLDWLRQGNEEAEELPAHLALIGSAINDVGEAIGGVGGQIVELAGSAKQAFHSGGGLAGGGFAAAGSAFGVGLAGVGISLIASSISETRALAQRALRESAETRRKIDEYRRQYAGESDADQTRELGLRRAAWRRLTDAQRESTTAVEGHARALMDAAFAGEQLSAVEQDLIRNSITYRLELLQLEDKIARRAEAREMRALAAREKSISEDYRKRRSEVTTAYNSRMAEIDKLEDAERTAHDLRMEWYDEERQKLDSLISAQQKHLSVFRTAIAGISSVLTHTFTPRSPIATQISALQGIGADTSRLEALTPFLLAGKGLRETAAKWGGGLGRGAQGQLFSEHAQGFASEIMPLLKSGTSPASLLRSSRVRSAVGALAAGSRATGVSIPKGLEALFAGRDVAFGSGLTPGMERAQEELRRLEAEAAAREKEAAELQQQQAALEEQRAVEEREFEQRTLALQQSRDAARAAYEGGMSRLAKDEQAEMAEIQERRDKIEADQWERQEAIWQLEDERDKERLEELRKIVSNTNRIRSGGGGGQGEPDFNPEPDIEEGGQPRAYGGPVGANRRYLVGEHGPEWFVPDRAGAVAPGAAIDYKRLAKAMGAVTIVVKAGRHEIARSYARDLSAAQVS